MGHKARRRPGKGAHLRTAPTARPSYRPHDELYAEALALLADRLAYAARTGNVPAWALARCWAEVALAWWCKAPR